MTGECDLNKRNANGSGIVKYSVYLCNFGFSFSYWMAITRSMFPLSYYYKYISLLTGRNVFCHFFPFRILPCSCGALPEPHTLTKMREPLNILGRTYCLPTKAIPHIKTTKHLANPAIPNFNTSDVFRSSLTLTRS